MEPAIEKRDISEIEQIYSNVFLKMNDSLRKTDYTAFNLKCIQDIAFRNVLAQAMIRAKTENIPFSLEILENIPVVEVPMLDTIRLLDILLNNALEAAEMAVHPKIEVAAADDEETTSIIVKNTRKPEVIDKCKIWEKGYSTKGKERGIGLTSLLTLIHELGNVEIETLIEKETFTQKLIFRKRGTYDGQYRYSRR